MSVCVYGSRIIQIKKEFLLQNGDRNESSKTNGMSVSHKASVKNVA